ncbi:MAG: hypothetical protein STHCBS139747_007085 [Sporothrix thermara]
MSHSYQAPAYHVSSPDAARGTAARPRATTTAYAPLSPKDLARSAEMFEWRPQIPLKFHIGSLDAMYREGKTYLAEHNYAKAYVLLMRFSIICVEKIPTHPEAHTPEGRRLVRTATRRLKTVMALLESIKSELVVARQRWAEGQAKRGETIGGGGGGGGGGADKEHSRQDALDTFAAQDPALSWNPHAQAELLDAADHVELAIALANKRAGTQVVDQDSFGGRLTRTGNDTRRDPDDVSREMERARWRLDEMAQHSSSGYGDDRRRHDHESDSTVVPVSYNYPSIHRSTPVTYEGRPSYSPMSAARPPLPPKQPSFSSSLSLLSSLSSSAHAPPPVPSRGEPLVSRRYNDDLFLLQQQDLEPSSATPTPTPPPPPPKTLDTSPPPPPRPAKSQYTFKPAAYLESGAPIRSVFLPDTLRRDFLRVAQPNTSRGIETCGILCGKTANNALFITCLLIPQQIGTRDSCETTGEVATLEYCSEHDLIQIGWIHTHPTQTCFMSSLDMHTHAGYQIMMDESIAIVCAPAHEPSWGIFRLTNPPGLPYIGGCRRAGAFHEHDLRPHEIYTEAKNPPGHVFVVPGIDYTVADLRDK